MLELRENQLASLSARVTTGLVNLKVLDARRNLLRELPLLPQTPALQQLLLSFNKITQLDATRLLGAENLATLDLADNVIESVDSTVADLRALSFLNLSNNALKGLPHALGYMPKLTRLLVEQNPIRSINRSVLTGSCEALKKYLQSRGPAPQAEADSAGGGGGASAWSVVEDQQLVLDKLPIEGAGATLESMLQAGKEYTTCRVLAARGTGGGDARFLPLVMRLLEAGQFPSLEQVDLERVGLGRVPVVLSQLPRLNHLSLASNQLSAASFGDLLALRARGGLPTYFPKLQLLNLAGNQLRVLSAAMMHGGWVRGGWLVGWRKSLFLCAAALSLAQSSARLPAGCCWAGLGVRCCFSVSCLAANEIPFMVLSWMAVRACVRVCAQD